MSISPSNDFWSGKKVLVTGHTGFKGGWLCLWLSQLGAKVHGLALDPPTEPSFYHTAKISQFLASDLRCDICDEQSLAKAVIQTDPEIIFHLAAQPLVRSSYDNPVLTYMTNVMGTVHLFEAARRLSALKAIVNITTDKCYENKEWVWAYRENEPMGGHDPYSNSKGCAELVTSSYRKSFFQSAGVNLASARAGNVIGGGDWAKDRLLPDFLQSISNGSTLTIRSPKATRPWQHVLEPVSGYILLAEALYQNGDDYSQGWNFGPREDDAKSVEWIVKKLSELEPMTKWKIADTKQPHEANMLMLSSAKANNQLNWKQRWPLSTALDKTVAWHNAWKNQENMTNFSIEQIKSYEKTIAHD